MSEVDEVIDNQLIDLHERLTSLAERAPQRWDKASITHVGTVSDEDTLQRVDLYRVELQPAVGDHERYGSPGPYDVLTATYIHNFWGDAEKRGEIADVVVLNGVDGYHAADPADTMFPPVPADG